MKKFLAVILASSVALPIFAQDKALLETLVKKGVTLTVASKRDITLIDGVCSYLKTKCSVHIKLNTGMNRLGASKPSEIKEILA